MLLCYVVYHWFIIIQINLSIVLIIKSIETKTKTKTKTQMQCNAIEWSFWSLKVLWNEHQKNAETEKCYFIFPSFFQAKSLGWKYKEWIAMGLLGPMTEWKETETFTWMIHWKGKEHKQQAIALQELKENFQLNFSGLKIAASQNILNTFFIQFILNHVFFFFFITTT